MKINNRMYSLTSALLLGLTTSFSCHAGTLAQSVRQALNFNPDVLFAVNHRYTTQEQYVQARADELPSIDVNAGYGPEKSENPTASGIGGQNNLTLPRRETSVSLTEHLFSGFGITNEINRTRETVQSSAYKISGVANDLALDVTAEYLSILRQQALVNIAQTNIAQHQAILNMIQQRSEAGIDRSADLKQAQGRLELAKANLVAQQSILDDAKVKYIKLVGSPPKNLNNPSNPSFPAIPKSLRAATIYAVANHPTLKAALADVSAALAQHQASKAANYPQLDLVLSASRNRDLDGIKGDNNDQMAMVRLSYNIFKGGKDIAQQRETAYEVQEAEEVKNRTILEIEQTLRLSWNALVNTQQRQDYLAGHVSAAKTTLDAYQEQFTAGKRSLFDLLDAQNELYQAQNDYLSSKYDVVFARYRILNAMGKLLPYLHVAVPMAATEAVPNNQWDSLKTPEVKSPHEEVQ